MPLLGSAALAMWWDMAPALRTEFEDWHSHEHFPERMRIPGFRRGSRWRSAEGGEGFFVLYELDGYATLTSAPYMARLNDPTPWSKRMMPHHRGMVRSQCRVVETFGGGIGASILTLRASPAGGVDGSLGATLPGTLAALVKKPGIVGAHLLRTETPDAPQTEEQRIRGGDAEAGWIVLVCGYDPAALENAARPGLVPGAIAGLYDVSLVATPADFQR